MSNSAVRRYQRGRPVPKMERHDEEEPRTMKYAIVLPDGAADEPLPQLDGRTPLEAANIPNMDWVALHGRLGRVVTVPPGFTPGTDVATLSLLGYDPQVCYSGRAPIEAAARGLTVGPGELIFRCNFVTIQDGLMKDFTADHIGQAEADRLIADLNELAGWPTSSEVGDTNRHSDSRPPRLKPCRTATSWSSPVRAICGLIARRRTTSPTSLSLSTCRAEPGRSVCGRSWFGPMRCSETMR